MKHVVPRACNLRQARSAPSRVNPIKLASNPPDRCTTRRNDPSSVLISLSATRNRTRSASYRESYLPTLTPQWRPPEVEIRVTTSGSGAFATACGAGAAAGAAAAGWPNASANIESIMLVSIAATTASSEIGAAGCGRMTGRILVLISPLTRIVLPALPRTVAPEDVDGRADDNIAAGGFGCRIRARDGARLKPMSINSVIFAFRAAVEAPPKTVAITRSWPRWADATRL